MVLCLLLLRIIMLVFVYVAIVVDRICLLVQATLVITKQG